MKLSPKQRAVLLGIAGGSRLKAHRYLSGEKVFRLHPLNGPPTPVPRQIVESLSAHGLIDSNKKFPAATYWLTPKGAEAAKTMQNDAS